MMSVTDKLQTEQSSADTAVVKSDSVQAAHGGALIPADYNNPEEAGWTEASRWLQRQEHLYQKQKLARNRYKLMKEVLGEI